MDKSIQEKIIDFINMKFAHAEAIYRLENGEQSPEACCDESDHNFPRFPDFDPIDEEAFKDIELPPPSKRHKIRMNRVFRERVGGTFLPFPEVDNIYDRVRSKLVIKLKINEISDRLKEGKRSR